MLDLNQNENQNEREPIPSGTKAVLKMRINPPDAKQKSEASPALTRSASSDAQYLNCEFEVMAGKYKGRKVFQNFTVMGGKQDSKGSIAGRITGQFLRAAWDAAWGLRPDDMSQAAVQKRMVPDYTSFDDIVFPATIAIRAAQNGYPPKNEIYIVITPDKPEYAKLMAGEEVEPANIGILGGEKAGKAKAATGSQTPDWMKTPQEKEQAAQGTGGFIPPQQASGGAPSLEPEWLRRQRAQG